MSRFKSTFVIFAAAAVAGCGSVTEPETYLPDAPIVDPGDPDGGPMGADGGEDGSDSTAPTVVSVAPVDGAVGVRPDQSIQIQFSEPMDQAAVEAAWTSPDLPAAAVDFTWNAGGDVLTVTPHDDLPLAEGTGLDPSAVERLELSYTIAASATDLAGNQLETELAVSFRTQRRLTASLNRIDPLTRTLRSDGLAFGETAVQLTVGDDSSNRQTKSFASFDVPELPAGAEIDRAVLTANQTSTNNTPYVLGAMEAFHVNVAAIDEAAFGPSLAKIGVISTSADVGQKTLEVTSYFEDDYANRSVRGSRTQYRLQFPTATNSNGVLDDVRFSRSGFALTVVYRGD